MLRRDKQRELERLQMPLQHDPSVFSPQGRQDNIGKSICSNFKGETVSSSVLPLKKNSLLPQLLYRMLCDLVNCPEHAQ